jgi:hypothetical protein
MQFKKVMPGFTVNGRVAIVLDASRAAKGLLSSSIDVYELVEI